MLISGVRRSCAPILHMGFRQASEDAYSLWEVMQFQPPNHAFVRQFACVLFSCSPWWFVFAQSSITSVSLVTTPLPNLSVPVSALLTGSLSMANLLFLCSRVALAPKIVALVSQIQIQLYPRQLAIVGDGCNCTYRQ